MDSRSRRAARTALVGGALAILTLAGHFAGGGGLEALGAALVALLALGLGWAVTAGALPLVRLLVLLVAGQGFLHLVLTFAAGHAHSPGTFSTTTMITGHLCAAAIAAVIVRHADALVDSWAAFLSAVIGVSPATAPAAIPQRSAALPGSPAEHARLLHLQHRVHRRGPPLAGVLTPA